MNSTTEGEVFNFKYLRQVISYFVINIFGTCVEFGPTQLPVELGLGLRLGLAR